MFEKVEALFLVFFLFLLLIFPNFFVSLFVFCVCSSSRTDIVIVSLFCACLLFVGFVYIRLSSFSHSSSPLGFLFPASLFHLYFPTPSLSILIFYNPLFPPQRLPFLFLAPIASSFRAPLFHLYSFSLCFYLIVYETLFSPHYLCFPILHSSYQPFPYPFPFSFLTPFFYLYFLPLSLLFSSSLFLFLFLFLSSSVSYSSYIFPLFFFFLLGLPSLVRAALIHLPLSSILSYLLYPPLLSPPSIVSSPSTF